MNKLDHKLYINYVHKFYVYLRVETFATSNGKNWIVYIHRRKVEKFRRTSQIAYPSVFGIVNSF